MYVLVAVLDGTRVGSALAVLLGAPGMAVLVGAFVFLGVEVGFGCFVLVGGAGPPLVEVGVTVAVPRIAVFVACAVPIMGVEVCCFVAVVLVGTAVLLTLVTGVLVPVAAATWAVRVLVLPATGALVAISSPVGVRLASDGELPGVRLPSVGSGVGAGSFVPLMPTGTTNGGSPICPLISDRLPYN